MDAMVRLRSGRQLRAHWRRLKDDYEKLANPRIRYNYHPVGWLYGQTLSRTSIVADDVSRGEGPGARTNAALYAKAYGKNLLGGVRRRRKWHEAHEVHEAHERAAEDTGTAGSLSGRDFENLFGNQAAAAAEPDGALDRSLFASILRELDDGDGGEGGQGDGEFDGLAGAPGAPESRDTLHGAAQHLASTEENGWTAGETTQVVVRNRRVPLYGVSESLAYMAFRAEATYSVAQRVLEETAFLLGRRRRQGSPDAPLRLLDFGTGAGSGVLAALAPPEDAASWPIGGDVKATVVDSSATMREAVGAMLDAQAEGGAGGAVRLAARETYEELSSAVAHQPPQDIVLCNYVLSEMPSDRARAAATALLWESLGPGGLLVVIERGNAFGSHVVRSARQFALDTYGSDARVVAPCAHDRPCPLPPGQFCAFGHRAPYAMRDTDSIIDAKRRGRLRGFRSEQFSFAVLQRGAAEGAEGGERHPVDVGGPVVSTVSPEELRRWIGSAEEREGAAPLVRLTRPAYLDLSIRASGGDADALEALAALHALHAEPGAQREEDRVEGPMHMAVVRDEWARIVRPPRKHKGHTVLDLCTPDGELKQLTISKARGNGQLPGGYRAVRNAEKGGIWPYPRGHVDAEELRLLLPAGEGRGAGGGGVGGA